MTWCFGPAKSFPGRTGDSPCEGMSRVSEDAEADLWTGLLGDRPRGMGTATEGLKPGPPSVRPVLTAGARSPKSFSFSLSSTGESSVAQR